MKPVSYVCMYSGMQNPEKQLSEEEVIKIREMVLQLDKVSEPIHTQLGFSGYSAAYDNTYIIANIRGLVSVFTTGVTYYYDTVGLFGYLATIMTPTLQKHYDDAATILKETESKG